MNFKYFTILIAAVSANAFSDTPTIDDSWQRHSNIEISKLHAYWDASSTRIVFDNGEVCYINKEDKELFSVALAMHAQKSKGSAICQVANSFIFEGKTARRLHILTSE